MDGADLRHEAPDAMRGRRARACRGRACASRCLSARDWCLPARARLHSHL